MVRTIVLCNQRQADRRSAVSHAERQAVWDSTLRLREHREGKTSVSLLLAGRDMVDSVAKEWAEWLPQKMNKLPASARNCLHLADFSNNAITSVGLESIVRAITQVWQEVNVFKVHGNRIEASGAVVHLIREATPQEVHLSHNLLCRDAMKDILEASVATGFYPRTGCAPLWLRMERNLCDGAGLARVLQANTLKAVCVVDGTVGCNPAQCHRKCSKTPAVHLTYLNLSGGQTPRPQAAASPPSFKAARAAGPNSAATAKAAASAQPPPPTWCALPRAATTSVTFDFSEAHFPVLSPHKQKLSPEELLLPTAAERPRAPPGLAVESSDRSSSLVADPSPSSCGCRGRTCSEESIIGAGATVVLTAPYAAEAEGYLTVARDQEATVLSAFPEDGEAGNSWSSYVYVQALEGEAGWVPTLLCCRCPPL